MFNAEIPSNLTITKKCWKVEHQKNQQKTQTTVCSMLQFLVFVGSRDKNSDNNGAPDRWSRRTTRRGLPMINCRGWDHLGFFPPDMWRFARGNSSSSPSPPPQINDWPLIFKGWELWNLWAGTLWIGMVRFFFSDATFWGAISGFAEPSQCFHCFGNNIPLESCGSWQCEIVVL